MHQQIVKICYTFYYTILYFCFIISLVELLRLAVSYMMKDIQIHV